MAVRVGVDLVEVSTVAESLDAHGEHYLRRLYTDREQADCTTERGVDPERLAARFAAKEATLKVLRLAGEGVSLTDIELRREPGGWVELELTGRPAELAREAGLEGFAVSVSHEGGHAVAVVTAELEVDRR